MAYLVLALWDPEGHRVSNTPELLDRLSQGPPADPPRAEEADAPLQVVPPTYEKHVECYRRTKVNVAEAVVNSLGERADEIGPELLEASGGSVKFPPFAELEEAARTLLHIWAALPMLDSNRSACLRLVDRYASVLMCVREGIAIVGDDAVSGNNRVLVSAAFENLTFAFEGVRHLLDQQSGRRFFKRYFQRNRIQETHSICDRRLKDAPRMFNIWVHFRLNRLVAAMDQRLEKDNIAAQNYANDISQGLRPVLPPHLRAAPAKQSSGLPLKTSVPIDPEVRYEVLWYMMARLVVASMRFSSEALEAHSPESDAVEAILSVSRTDPRA